MGKMAAIDYCKFFLLGLCVVGCAPSSLQDLRCEAEGEMRKLALDLRSIETKEDLQRRSSRLKKRFDRIGYFLLEARKFPDTALGASFEAEALFVELARLYEIAGAREIIEQLQEEAVRRLDRKSRN